MDKTGTITKGNFVVQKANPAGNAMTANDLLAISASCELSSTHPIGNSIVEAAEEKGLSIERPSKVEEIAGHGIRAELSRGVVLCGNRKLMDAQNVDLSVYQKENFGTEVLGCLKWQICWKYRHFRYSKRRCQRCNRRCKETGNYYSNAYG